MFIEFLVPLLALVRDFDDIIFFGRLCRPLTHGGRGGHGRRGGGIGEGLSGLRSYHLEFIDRPGRFFDPFIRHARTDATRL